MRCRNCGRKIKFSKNYNGEDRWYDGRSTGPFYCGNKAPTDYEDRSKWHYPLLEADNVENLLERYDNIESNESQSLRSNNL